MLTNPGLTRVNRMVIIALVHFAKFGLLSNIKRIDVVNSLAFGLLKCQEDIIIIG